MESFGIVLSIPVAFLASMLYSLFLKLVVIRYARPTRWLRLVSIPVLAIFALEIVLLVSLGSVRSRGLLGPGFYVVHIFLFFLGPPALANVLVLRPRPASTSTWYVATALCTVFAFVLVLLQYSVSESLYGIDGDDGPYSSRPQ